MKQALKGFGLGLVYFFLLPVFLVLIAIAGVFALGVIVVTSVKGLIRFFKGDKFFSPLPEDVRVNEIKEYQTSLQTAPTPAVNPNPTDNRVFIQQNYYPNPQGPYGNQTSQQPQPYNNSNPGYQGDMQQPHFVDSLPQNNQQNPSLNAPHPGEIPTQNPPVIDMQNDNNGGNNV